MRIETFSSSIRRKEMDAVLTCMVNEKIGPGGINKQLVSAARDFFGAAGAAAFRSPATALRLALDCLSLECGSLVAVSALSPCWHFSVVREMGFSPLAVDVESETAAPSRVMLEEAVQTGARAVIFYDALGFLPSPAIFEHLGVPVIEDVSRSAGGFYFSFQREDGAFLDKKSAGFAANFVVAGLESDDAMTAGGGALAMAHSDRDWPPLERRSSEAQKTDILPDLNSALGLVQIREFLRNEAARKKIREVFEKSVSATRHRAFFQANFSSMESCAATYSFAVLLESGVREARLFAEQKGVLTEMAFADSAACLLPAECEECKTARSLMLRTVFFPLYPRLSTANVEKIARILSVLP